MVVGIGESKKTLFAGLWSRNGSGHLTWRRGWYLPRVNPYPELYGNVKAVAVYRVCSSSCSGISDYKRLLPVFYHRCSLQSPTNSACVRQSFSRSFCRRADWRWRANSTRCTSARWELLKDWHLSPCRLLTYGEGDFPSFPAANSVPFGMRTFGVSMVL